MSISFCRIMFILYTVGVLQALCIPRDSCLLIQKSFLLLSCYSTSCPTVRKSRAVYSYTHVQYSISDDRMFQIEVIWQYGHMRICPYGVIANALVRFNCPAPIVHARRHFFAGMRRQL